MNLIDDMTPLYRKLLISQLLIFTLLYRDGGVEAKARGQIYSGSEFFDQYDESPGEAGLIVPRGLRSPQGPGVSERNVQACGLRLLNELSSFCFSSAFTSGGRSQKRQDHRTSKRLANTAGEDTEVGNADEFPNPRNIVEECCRSGGCKLSQLVKYCHHFGITGKLITTTTTTAPPPLPQQEPKPSVLICLLLKFLTWGVQQNDKIGSMNSKFCQDSDDNRVSISTPVLGYQTQDQQHLEDPRFPPPKLDEQEVRKSQWIEVTDPPIQFSIGLSTGTNDGVRFKK